MTTMQHPTTINAPAATQYIEIVREFDAPRADVFRAMTDPGLVVQWLGPRKHQMHVDHWDARTGGGYRYLHHDGPGSELQAWFHGVYHLVRSDELVIQTFEYEGFPDEVALETARYDDLGDGRTRLTTRSVFSSEQMRDGALASGMEHGVRDSMDRLAELLAG